MLRARNESATNPLATESLGSRDAATEHAIGKRLLVVGVVHIELPILAVLGQGKGNFGFYGVAASSAAMNVLPA